MIFLLRSFDKPGTSESIHHVSRHLLTSLTDSCEIGSTNCTEDGKAAEQRDRHLAQSVLDVEQAVEPLVFDGTYERGELVVLVGACKAQNTLHLGAVKVDNLVPEIDRDVLAGFILHDPLECLAILNTGNRGDV